MEANTSVIVSLDNYLHKDNYFLFPILINSIECAYLKLNNDNINSFKEFLNYQSEVKNIKENAQNDSFFEFKEDYPSKCKELICLSVIQDKHTLKNIFFALNFLH